MTEPTVCQTMRRAAAQGYPPDSLSRERVGETLCIVLRWDLARAQEVFAYTEESWEAAWQLYAAAIEQDGDYATTRT